MTHKAFIRIPKQVLRTFSLFHLPHNLDETANTKHIPPTDNEETSDDDTSLSAGTIVSGT